MPDRPVAPERFATLLLALALLLPACGGETDGSASGRPSPAGLLQRLERRVSEGQGISDATWTAEVMEVALALWPDDADPGMHSARRDHTSLAHIAGDMAVQLRAEPGARDAWAERDAGSVAIHDAFVEAARRGVGAYRQWVEGPGRALLARRHEALMEDRPR